VGIEIHHLLDHTQHIPTVAAWQQAEFGYLSPNGTLEQRVERLRSASDKALLPISLVAISDGEGDLVGSASLVATTLTHQHLSPWLSSVFVPPTQRGRGIASKLALAAIAEADRLGFEKIFLFTPKSEALYARLGWETFERTAINGVSTCLMARSTR
jgi:predicted N-acetyltransferase YhbS